MGIPHVPWTNLPLCGFGPVPMVFRQSLGWEVSFQVCYLSVPTKEEIQSRALGKSEGTTQTMAKIGALGHGRPNILSLHPATKRPYLRTWLRLRVTMCVCDQCGQQASPGIMGHTGFNYTELWTTCQSHGFLPWERSSDFCIIFNPGQWLEIMSRF